MNREEAIHKLEYSKKAYQTLIDEKVDSGKLVGKDIKGEWKADTPLDEAYKSMIDALEMAIKALEQELCSDARSLEAVLNIVDSYSESQSNVEDVTQDIISDIMALQPVNPQQICGDAISRQWLMECVNEGWIKFDTEQDKNIFIHLVRDIAPPVTPQGPTDKSNLEKICEELKAENDDLRDQLAMRDRFQKQEPCEDAINRVDALMCLTGEIKGTDTIETIIARFGRRIRKLPPVTPQPKTGHWIEQIDHEENCRTLICSNCDRPALHDGDSIWKHKFCPHCGARMIEPQERSDKE